MVVRPLAALSPASDTPSTIVASPGGSGANQAAWLGHLGAAVRFAGRVGAAGLARHAEELAHHGVEAHLTSDPVVPTGAIVVLVSADGERSMFTDRGANLGLSAQDLGDDLLDGVALLHLSGYALFDPGGRTATLDLVGRARRRHVALSVDPGSERFLRAAGPEDFLGWVGDAEILFPNLDEGRVLSGLVEPEDVAGALLGWAAVVVLKVGAAGLLVATREGERLWRPAVPAQVVDTTGAGDASCAGFLAAWLDGQPLSGCADLALAAAARAVTRLGGRPG